jgi:hypothetical protein
MLQTINRWDDSYVRRNQMGEKRKIMSKKLFKLFFLLFVISFLGASVAATPEYLRLFAADPLSRVELRNKCSVCHINPAGGGPRNDFGKAFADVGLKLTPELRRRFPDRFLARDESQVELPKVSFLQGSDSEAVLELDGKRFLINTKDQTVSLLAADPGQSRIATTAPRVTERPHRPDVYEQVDVRLINLPTAMPIDKGALWVDFSHRFPFNEVNDRAGLFGLDGFAVPAFGFTYGVTDRIHVGAYRAPTTVGRPIQIFAGASLLEERDGQPFNLQARMALEGRDNFQRNFTTSFELAFARSITRGAQIYVSPTVSVGDRPIVSPDRNYPGRTAFALGIGAAVDIRPSVALMAEVNMRLNERSRYVDGQPEFGRGIHRPVVGFGVQKASSSRKHSFSLTFSNGFGTTFAQRSMTRGLFFTDDSFSGMTIGFNITRRLD